MTYGCTPDGVAKPMALPIRLRLKKVSTELLTGVPIYQLIHPRILDIHPLWAMPLVVMLLILPFLT
jgi:hypothetical protein